VLCAALTVADTGCGIASDLLPRICEPFTKGDVTSVQRLSIGLAIARQLVARHGGTIHASSADLGRGAGSSSRCQPGLPPSNA
jgi:signal transduction histidine kinase